MRRLKSKERVRLVFSRQEPDRVPLNYFANPGIDLRLKAHFGLAENDSEGLLQALGIDFRSTGAPYTGPRLHAEVAGRNVDPTWGIRTRWIEHPSGGYWDFCDFPLREASLEIVETWPLPSPDDFDYAQVHQDCHRWKDYCVVAGHAGLPDVINGSGMLFTMQQVLIGLITDEPALLRYIERKSEILFEITHRTLEAAQGGIDALWLGEDLGTQRGPLISLPLYRKHLRPWHQRFTQLGKEFCIPVAIHSCGSSSWAFEDFIEMGIQVVDTLQPEAKDMAPESLKKRFGDRLAFHGCISTAGVVAHGTVQEVDENVRQTLEVMKPGGGYALSPTHMLQDNSPTENVLALYSAAAKYGRY